MSETNRTYKARTVISAQRRVLGMVAAQIEQMGDAERSKLRVDRRTGFITWEDILTHVNAARALKLTPETKEP